MKNYILIFLFFLIEVNSSGQSISRQVQAAGGKSFSDSSIQVSYTLGETFTQTFSNGVTSSQGFQQPDSVMPVTASISAATTLSFCAGGQVILHANTGVNLIYQWQLNGVNILGANNAYYTAVQSGSYQVRVSNEYGFYKLSNSLLVTVYTLPIVTSSITPSSLVCYGTGVNIYGGGASTYSWSGGISNAVSFNATTTNTYTVTGTDAHGCTSTSSLTLNVKPQPLVTPVSNISYCNGQAVSAVPLTGSPSGVLFDISGGASKGLPNQFAVSSIPAFTATPTGSAIISITPKANGCMGPVSTYTMTVSNCPPVTLNLKFYIQGYYTGNGMMQPVLYNEGEIPDPNSLITDYIIVELHSTTAPYPMVKTTLATLKTNGTLICNFPGSVTNTPFYIVIHHRNSVETWSANPVMITSNATYDFSNAVTKAFGENEVQVEPNVWAIYSGDINQDGAIDAFDFVDLDPDVFNGNGGYLATDLNGDGSVDAFDFVILDPNIQAGIGAFVP